MRSKKLMSKKYKGKRRNQTIKMKSLSKNSVNGVGGTKRKREEDEPSVGKRQSNRLNGFNMQTKQLDENQSTKGYDRHKSFLPNKQKVIESFVENLEDGPQIITFPMEPYNHTILVDIQTDKIMIADWIPLNGKDTVTGFDPLVKRFDIFNPNSRIEKTDEDINRHQDYLFILILLHNKDGIERPIVYYPVDMKLKKEKWEKAKKTNQGKGGCSDYMYDWEPKYYSGSTYTGHKYITNAFNTFDTSKYTLE
jgi:hypothetical protein